jgi:hypothetical protein
VNTVAVMHHHTAELVLSHRPSGVITERKAQFQGKLDVLVDFPAEISERESFQLQD